MTIHSSYNSGMSRESHWANGHLDQYPIEKPIISLPSIRQAFPDFEKQRQRQQDIIVTTQSSATSPVRRSFNADMMHPEYIHSSAYPTRRFEIERREDVGRTNSVPRLCTSSNVASYRSVSPPLDSRADVEAWGKSNRARSPTGDIPLLHPVILPGPPDDVDKSRIPWRSSLLELARSIIGAEKDTPRSYAQRNRTRARSLGDISTDNYRIDNRRPAYRPTGYHDGYRHPNRVQSLSVGSAHPFDRPMFSSIIPTSPYGHQTREGYIPTRDIGAGGNYEGKQRKRRGNLPKETTDKLRAWFHAHLSHPYPTEEEKQQLMKDTGLQLNQISNWFINARRRQLPNMINNARAEADAMNVRVAENNLLPSTERTDYDADGRPSSDEDPELESIKRRRVNGNERGSI
ncbi:hypothetical protein Daesc_008480 [Daldinia eschscholtzii]|uniref:Homeobox domain-containing protein n=1 Tax=Daldinia eschscholtzii TaxID=292717 RepID=A0AAX6MCG3_9PEZI